jgi:hypothetical protein
MQVNITKRIDTTEGNRYCPVVVGPNGRIKPDWVMVNDRQEKHPEGAYYLDRNEDGKRRRMSVGNDAASAYNRRARKQRELDAIAAGHHARLSSVFAPHIGHPHSEDLDSEYLNILETRTRTPFFQDVYVYVGGVRVMLIIGPTGAGKSVHCN